LINKTHPLPLPRGEIKTIKDDQNFNTSTNQNLPSLEGIEG